MRRMTYFVMAMALVLGFTQCKKEQPTPQSQGVRITLNVNGGNSNSRVIVNPTGHTSPDYATVTFEENDVIYVGNNGAYVGYLTYSGSNFSGYIDDSNLSEADYLHFYFMGNKGEKSEPSTVSITDQTAKYPVISYAHSNEFYGTTDSYSAKLQNYCAIVKFTTNDIPTATAVTVKGMRNTVSVDFGKNNAAESKLDINPYTPGQSGDRDIILHAVSNTERWAILLEQDEVENATVTADDYFDGTCNVPEIANNTYHTGVEVSLESKTINLSEVTGDKTIKDGCTVTGTLVDSHKITIADGATVTLNNVSINADGTFSNKECAGITCLGDATIILADGTTNTVKGFSAIYPGIYVPESKTLTISGSGSLNASSNGYAAGIGGGNGISCGNIEIQGGTITATGGDYAAGIGSAAYANCGDITISGGTVTATGGGSAAGIGCGANANCGDITISGGTVTATASGIGTPGIGSGFGSSCGDIIITSDVIKVTATMGDYANYSIGAGNNGTVTIGGTDYPDGATPNQADGVTFVYPEPEPVEQIVDLSMITSNYTAVDGDILTGTLGTGVQISIADGATVTLRSANINGNDNLSGAFHGLKCNGDATIILENEDNVVKAKRGTNRGRAGIFVPQDKTLTIQGGNYTGRIEATGDGEASGIGGYYEFHCGAIVINSGKVVATAGSLGDWGGYAAGIGACGYRKCDGITITGGQTTATAYGYASGIGLGGDEYANGFCNPGDQDAITINISTGGGWVKAYKGDNATYFIGGGSSEHCGYVKVGSINYEDGGNRGITSSTPSSIDLMVGETSVVYMP